MSKTKGFIYVASRHKHFYEMGLLSAESLRDFYPDANITMFTHKAWVDDRAKIFSNVVTHVPYHRRTKIWAMSHTPYDQTFYNDCDSLILHPDIKNVFDYLDDRDMFFCESFWYTTGDYRWSFIDKAQTVKVPYHGAVCCYNKNDLTIDFMNTWFKRYNEQQQYNWHEKWGDFAYQSWQYFDMFTLWEMTCGRFEEFERFNNLNIKLAPKRFCTTIHDKGTKAEYSNKPPVVMQIDRHTYQELASWKRINKGIKDERSLPKELEIGKDSLGYN